MLIEEAYRHVVRSYPGDPGQFYEPGTRLAIGKGEIYQTTRYPLFDDDSETFLTVEGIGYVLTHECDVDEANDRTFNSLLLICPLVPLQDLVEEYSATLPQEQLVSLLANMGARNISRVRYLPPIADVLPYGSVMYLNQITHSGVATIKSRSRRVCALTGVGLREVEYALENHLLRPKADRLALTELVV